MANKQNRRRTQSTIAERNRWKHHALLMAMLWALLLLAYSNSFHAGFVYDNRGAILEDSRIREVGAENTHLILTQDYWYRHSVSGLFRPLTTFSYQFNYAVLGNGESPAGYHEMNLAIHAVNVVLVYLLALLLLQETAPAFAMAALWALHPVLTESVTNIVGRSDLLSAFGVLAGLLCYSRGVLAGGWRRAAWLAALTAFTAIAMFSKESGIVVLAVVLLYDLTFSRGSLVTKEWRSRGAAYLAMGLPVAVYFLVRHDIFSKLRAVVFVVADNSLVGSGFWTSRLTAIKIVRQYLWLLVWPARLSCDYSYNQVPLFSWRFDNPEDWKAIFGLAMLVTLAAVALFCFRRARPVFFFIAFFFVTLAPTSNLLLLIGSNMAERFLYLPSIGFVGCVAWAGWAVYRRVQLRWPPARNAAVAVLSVVCLCYSARTFARNADWRDGLSLWSSAIEVAYNSYRTHSNLAQQWLELPDGAGLERAAGELGHAMAILKSLPDQDRVPAVYADAGLCYRRLGDRLAQSAAAQADYDPQTNPWYRKSLGTYLEGERIDRLVNAAAQRANSSEGKTASPTGAAQLYLGLGRLYMRLREPEKALAEFDYGRKIKPQVEFFEQMSATYRSMGDNDRAAVALMEGLAMDSSQVRLASEVVQLYRETAPQSCALNGSGLNLGCPLVHGHVCSASRNLAEMYLQMQLRLEAATVKQVALGSLGCPAEWFR
jgi:protein O-mannosyl-transferase